MARASTVEKQQPYYMIRAGELEADLDHVAGLMETISALRAAQARAIAERDLARGERDKAVEERDAALAERADFEDRALAAEDLAEYQHERLQHMELALMRGSVGRA